MMQSFPIIFKVRTVNSNCDEGAVSGASSKDLRSYLPQSQLQPVNKIQELH